MANTFVHGLCVWPSSGVSVDVGNIFHRRLPEDLTQILAWVNESPSNVLTVIIAKRPHWDFQFIAALRPLARSCYIIVWHPDAVEDPVARIKAFQGGANMVTNDLEALHQALQRITSTKGSGNLTCPWCGLAGLSTLELWHHQPLYHIYEVRVKISLAEVWTRHPGG